MLKIKKDVREKIGMALLILLTLARVCLMMGIPSYLHADAVYDDALLIKYAESLSRFQWLGAYNKNTLVKGISFSLFLTLCKWLSLPYSLGLSLLYVASASVFALAFCKIIKNKWALGLIYLAILYSPVGFNATQRVYRMAVVPPAVILAVACMAGLYFRREEPLKILAKWAVGAGISFSFFWYIREDSIWLAPFFVAAMAALLLYYLFINKNIGGRYARVLASCLPLAIATGCVFSVCAINKTVYGVFTDNDRSKTGFADMTASMLKLDRPSGRGDVWISKEAMKQMIEASPALQSVESTLLMCMDNWASSGEMPGDHFTWMMRDVLEAEGYYETAQKADAFCRRVCLELERAYKSGMLPQRDAIYFSSQSRGITFDEIPYFMQRAAAILLDAARYRYSSLDMDVFSTGTPQQIRWAEAFLREPVINQPYTNPFCVKGWIFAKGDKDALTAELLFGGDGGKAIPLAFLESSDVKTSFGGYENAAAARFELQLEAATSQEDCLRIYINGQLEDTISMGEIPLGIQEKEHYFICLDNMEWSPSSDPIVAGNGNKIRLGDHIIGIYQKTGFLFAALAILAYTVLSVFMLMDIKNKGYGLWDAWLVLTGIFASLWILAVGVAIFTDWIVVNGAAGYHLYFAGAFSMLQMFEYIVIWVAGREAYQRFRHRRFQHRKLGLGAARRRA